MRKVRLVSFYGKVRLVSFHVKVRLVSFHGKVRLVSYDEKVRLVSYYGKFVSFLLLGAGLVPFTGKVFFCLFLFSYKDSYFHN